MMRPSSRTFSSVIQVYEAVVKSSHPVFLLPVPWLQEGPADAWLDSAPEKAWRARLTRSPPQQLASRL